MISFFHWIVFLENFLISPFSPFSLRTSATFAPLRLVFPYCHIVWLRAKAAPSSSAAISIVEALSYMDILIVRDTKENRH